MSEFFKEFVKINEKKTTQFFLKKQRYEVAIYRKSNTNDQAYLSKHV